MKRSMMVRILGAAALVAACGTTGESGTSDSPAGEGLPVVRFAGGETTDFGSGDQPTCGAMRPIEVAPEAAIERGHDPDGAREAIEGTIESPLSWNDCDREGSECSSTTLQATAWVDSFLRVPYRSSVEGVECPEELHVRTLVQLTTADGKLAGAFYVRVHPTSDGWWRGEAVPDLRNFEGSLQLPIDEEHPHWSMLNVDLPFGDPAAQGKLGLTVAYVDGSAGSLHEAPLARWSAEPLPEEGGPTFQVLGTGEEPMIKLGDYQGSLEPPTSALEACVFAVEPSAPVDLIVGINGEETTYSALDTGTCIDLGELPRDTRVTAEAANNHDAGSVEASIRTDCSGVAVEDCEGSGCSARAEHTVRYVPCIT